MRMHSFIQSTIIKLFLMRQVCRSMAVAAQAATGAAGMATAAQGPAPKR
jgi:hypothetical protein